MGAGNGGRFKISHKEKTKKAVTFDLTMNGWSQYGFLHIEKRILRICFRNSQIDKKNEITFVLGETVKNTISLFFLAKMTKVERERERERTARQHFKNVFLDVKFIFCPKERPKNMESNPPVIPK